MKNLILFCETVLSDTQLYYKYKLKKFFFKIFFSKKCQRDDLGDESGTESEIDFLTDLNSSFTVNGDNLF